MAAGVFSSRATDWSSAGRVGSLWRVWGSGGMRAFYPHSGLVSESEAWRQGNRVLHRHRRKVPEKTVSGPKRSFGPDTVFSGDSSMPSAEDAIALAWRAKQAGAGFGHQRLCSVPVAVRWRTLSIVSQGSQKAVGGKQEAEGRRQDAGSRRHAKRAEGRQRTQSAVGGQRAGVRRAKAAPGRQSVRRPLCSLFSLSSQTPTAERRKLTGPVA